MTAAAGVIVITIGSYGAAVALGLPLLTPLLNTAAAYVVMVRRVKRGEVDAALGLMLVWAVSLGVSATVAAAWWPDASSRAFFNAAAYRDEMFAWVSTGVGRETQPGAFVPQHLLHVTIFVGLSLISASALSMLMGAVLMNYMGFYVGSLAVRSGSHFWTALLGWHPWAIVRVASFVTLGVVLSVPGVARATGRPWTLGRHPRLLGAAVAGLVLDLVLKWLLAPAWQPLLKRLAGL